MVSNRISPKEIKMTTVNSKEKVSPKGSERMISHPDNVGKLLSLQNKVVFVHDTHTNSFQAIFKISNKSCHYVSYIVRPSNRRVFKIRPRFGFIPPRDSIEVIVMTRNVKEFHEFSQEYFAVFAVPIYDKRQLERKKLDMLWRAQGTKMFPFEATEFHKILYILPKSDHYYDNIPLVGRIYAMGFISRMCIPDTVFENMTDEKPIDEETFFLNWPPEDMKIMQETRQLLIKDWDNLMIRINNQTQNVIDSLKTLFSMFLSGGTTFIALYHLYKSDATPFGFKVDTPEVQQEIYDKGWFSW